MSKEKTKRKKITGPSPMLPYKILLLLLYGNYKSVDWIGDQCMIKVTDFCKTHGIHRHRFYEYMDYLKETGFVKDMASDRGYVVVQIQVPAKFQVDIRDFMTDQVEAIKLRDKRN